MKKILALVAALSVIVSLASAGTIAYLTDTKSAKNTMTMGNVSIEQNEYKDKELTEKFVDTDLYPGQTLGKYVTVTNTGKSPAYVRTFVAFEKGTTDNWKNVIQYTKNENQDEWKWSDKTYSIKVGGVDYEVLVADYAKTLTTTDEGKTTPASLYTVSMKKEATNDDVAAFGDEYTVLVMTQAVQTAGFANAAAAFTGAFEGEAGLNDKLIQKWFGGEADPDDPETPAAGDDDSVDYEIPEGTEYTTVSSTEDLKAALNNKVATILLKDGEYNWSGTGHNGTAQSVSIYGESKNAIIKVTNEGGEGSDNDFDGYTVTFTNLTITSDNDWTAGWKRMSATFNDCVINNNLNLVSGNHVFNYCTLNQTGDQYNIWTYGASNAEFNYCTFNCAGKSIYVDGNGSNKTVLKVNNCVFNDNGGVENKAAIETGTTYGTTYDLIVNNTTVNGFAVNPNGASTNSTLWANKHSMTQDKLNVVVDGVDVY